jgi:hypothetical protein
MKVDQSSKAKGCATAAERLNVSRVARFRRALPIMLRRLSPDGAYRCTEKRPREVNAKWDSNSIPANVKLDTYCVSGYRGGDDSVLC